MDTKFDGKTSHFARKIGVSATTVADIYDGKTNAGGKVVMAISEAFPDIDLNWLLRNNQDFSTEKAEEPAVRYESKEDLYNYKLLIEKVKELDALVQKITKKLDL